MAESSIFINKDVLSHDFIPEVLPHREKEIFRLASILAPSLKGEKCSNLFIYGKTGTGKTAVSKYVLARLEKKSLKLQGRVKVCYVNCRLAGTEYRVTASLCSALSLQIPFTGLSTAEVLNRLFKRLSQLGVYLVVVLDEVDELVKGYGDRLLYELTRSNSLLSKGKISLVGISNDLYFKELLDPRVLSSLSEEEIVFKPYTASQIKDILLQRAKMAFKPGSLPLSTLNLCAALAASEHGDARRALDLLRVAGEIAEREGATKVEERHVHEAQRKIEHDRTVEVLASLPLHSKILLAVLYFNGKPKLKGLTTGELYEGYVSLCRKAQVEPLTHRRVSGLLSELDMLGVVEARLVSLGRYGRTKKIQLKIPKKTLEKAFLEDVYFASLTENGELA
ncbi:MAG: cell division control protein Cdc6 [Candidatus Hecatellales archaeon]|nr:MAG: cell division control protein Cdc6 [Candidatus Hecatellales archaeon]